MHVYLSQGAVGEERWCNDPPALPAPAPEGQLRSRRRESDLGSPSPSSNGHRALGGRGHKTHTDDPQQDALSPGGFCEWKVILISETYRS